jgi:hypothetical protein
MNFLKWSLNKKIDSFAYLTWKILKKLNQKSDTRKLSLRVTEFICEKLIYNKIDDFVICCRADSVRRRNRKRGEGCCLTDQFHFHVYFFGNYISINNIPIYLLFFPLIVILSVIISKYQENIYFDVYL